MTEQPVSQEDIIDLLKEHLIPYPKSADAQAWNERVGYLLEDILNLYKGIPKE